MQVNKHRYNCKKPLLYACNFCGRKFTTDCQRRRHEKLHIEKSYACEFCAKCFDFRGMLIKHMKNCNGKQNDCNVKCETENVTKQNKENDTKYVPRNITKHFQCKVCRKIFPTNETYEKHFVDVHIKNSLKCQECSFIFQHRDELDEHAHNPITKNKMYSCNICVKAFSNIKCLNCHKEITHKMLSGNMKILNTASILNKDNTTSSLENQSVANIECDIMDFEPMNTDSDGSMVSSETDNQKPNFANASFSEEYSSEDENNFKKTEFKCLSGSKYISTAASSATVEISERPNSGLGTCFSKKLSLRKKLKSVSYEDSLVDDIVFESDYEIQTDDILENTNIRKHSIRHLRFLTLKKREKLKKQEISKKAMIDLPKCYVKIKKLSIQNILALTGGNASSIDIPIIAKNMATPNEILKQIGIDPRDSIGLKCDCCKAVFKSSKEKIQHMRHHHENLTYKCKDCEKLFKNRCNLSRHYIGQHAGINFFKCQLCDRAFNYKDSLNRHIKFHFQENRYPCKVCDERFIDLYELRIHRISHHT